MLGRTIAAVGLIAVIAGFILGSVPVRSGGVACGSAFVAQNHRIKTLESELAGRQVSCASSRKTMRIPAVALLVIGSLGMASGGVVGMVRMSAASK